MKRILLLFFIVSSSVLHAQEESLLANARVIFYNVENLFDTINDPETIDEEFLPQSKSEWNTAKYQTKLEHVAHVIASLLDSVQPLVVGLAEVENKKVVEDLIAMPELKKFNFGIAHHDSPDKRGIDVAILYNKELIEEVFDAFLPVEVGEDHTRDILYLKGFVIEDNPFWIFVNHWPSRRVETDTSGAKRLIAAQTLKRKIENVYLGEPSAYVMVMGDFNDNPTDSSVKELSKTNFKYPEQENLINLMKPLYLGGKFTARYKNDKDVFDQFIVSNNLLDKKNPCNILNGSAKIYSPQWLMFNHPKYGWVPNRTYANGKYTGGYSDHLPVYFDIVFK